jgi:hypothetical protein
MTDPRLTRRNHGRGHGYRLDGRKVPGVTTVQGVLGKDGLIDWAARQAASYAIENWTDLGQLPMLERADKIRRARFETNDAAKLSGTKIHHYGHRLALEDSVQVPAEYRAPAEAYARLLDDLDMDIELAEAPCANTIYGYGGTLDAIGTSPQDGRTLIDLKTGNAVYQDTALQINAYAGCDIVQRVEPGPPGPRGGTKNRPPKITELPMGDFDTAYVIHIRGDVAEARPCSLDPFWLEQFLYALELWRGRERSFNSQSDEFDPPIGDPIRFDDDEVEL